MRQKHQLPCLTSRSKFYGVPRFSYINRKSWGVNGFCDSVIPSSAFVACDKKSLPKIQSEKKFPFPKILPILIKPYHKTYTKLRLYDMIKMIDL